MLKMNTRDELEILMTRVSKYKWTFGEILPSRLCIRRFFFSHPASI